MLWKKSLDEDGLEVWATEQAREGGGLYIGNIVYQNRLTMVSSSA